MRTLIDRVLAIAFVAFALLLTIAFFPLAAVYFLATGVDISGRFLP